jgi:2-aminoadipate transaminase
MNTSAETMFSKRSMALKPSAVREILKAAERPDVISLAGGLPAPELFPAEAISQAYIKVLNDKPGAALQYGITEGFGPLREWIIARMKKFGIKSGLDRLLISNGSQQGIDLVGRAILNPGDVVVTENPAYLAALQSFASCEAEVVAVGSDDNGMLVDELDELLARKRAKLIYLCPNFQNPKGTTLIAERRQLLIDIARKYSVPILEDDPYGELRFRGEAPKALAALEDELVIRLGTFSKTLAPGLRIGWIHGAPSIIRRLAILKQSTDLHTATLAQWAAAALLETFDFDKHIAMLQVDYLRRCDAMLTALDRHMPAGCKWTKPDGGLFVWLQLPEGVSEKKVFDSALRRGVAVVPGSGFFVGKPPGSFLRLNYSNQTIESINSGVERLAEAMKTAQRE